MGLEKLGRLWVPLLFGTLALLGCRSASALPAYLEAAKAAYNFKAGGVVETKSCSLCHAGATNRTSLNLYGKDVQAALKSAVDKKVTPALIHRLDDKDSDGDGWSNAAEFSADTLPGDSSSKPAGLPPASSKPKQPAVVGDESNPFSLQALFYPTHAQHPVIVHFPIALFIFSLFLDLFGVRTGNRALNTAAYYNLVAAAVTGVLSVITGLLAWRFAFNLEPLSADKWLLFHLVLGVTTTVLMCTLWAIRVRMPTTDARPLSRLYIILGVLTMAVIALTGHFGGIISGVVK